MYMQWMWSITILLVLVTAKKQCRNCVLSIWAHLISLEPCDEPLKVPG